MSCFSTEYNLKCLLMPLRMVFDSFSVTDEFYHDSDDKLAVSHMVQKYLRELLDLGLQQPTVAETVLFMTNSEVNWATSWALI